MSEADNQILIYGKDNTQGIVSIEVEDDKLILFIQNADGSITTETRDNRFWILSSFPIDSGWVRLTGNSYYKYGKQFKTKKEFLIARNKYRKYDTYSVYNSKESAMIKDGMTYLKGMKPNDLSVLSFDIETAGLNPEAPNAQVYLITNTFRYKESIVRRTFDLTDYDSDADMIESWCSWVRDINPSVLVGHNINVFDFVYLNKRSYEGLHLGRNGSVMEVEKYARELRKDGSQSYTYHRNNIYGREIIDTFFLALKYDIKRRYESYGLKSLIREEGLEKKDRTFVDASKMSTYYTDPEMWTLVVKYAEEDSDDALKLYDLMSPVQFYLSQVVPKSFQVITESAAGSQINSVMVRAYLQNKESIPKASEISQLQGAISFAIPGIYSNCLKIDFSQLYPSIMMQYEVYDTFKDPNKYFATLVKHFAATRQHYKTLYKETGNKEYDDQQEVAKTVANSCYGFLSASGLNFNSPEQAAFITSKARELLSFSIQWATSKDVSYWKELFEQRTN